MPQWAMHIKTVRELVKKLDININSFLLGNLLPDAEAYILTDLSYYVPYPTSHYMKWVTVHGIEQKLPQPEKFIKNHKGQFDNPIVLGYLVHLLTDKFWNQKSFDKNYKSEDAENPIAIKMNNGILFVKDREEFRVLKSHDFDLYSNYIQTYEKMLTLAYEESMLKELKQISEIPIQKTDIDKYISYIAGLNEPVKEEKGEYLVFTKEEFDRDFEESLVYIKDFLVSHQEEMK